MITAAGKRISVGGKLITPQQASSGTLKIYDFTSDKDGLVGDGIWQQITGPSSETLGAIHYPSGGERQEDVEPNDGTKYYAEGEEFWVGFLWKCGATIIPNAFLVYMTQLHTRVSAQNSPIWTIRSRPNGTFKLEVNPNQEQLVTTYFSPNAYVSVVFRTILSTGSGSLVQLWLNGDLIDTVTVDGNINPADISNGEAAFLKVGWYQSNENGGPVDGWLVKALKIFRGTNGYNQVYVGL